MRAAAALLSRRVFSSVSASSSTTTLLRNAENGAEVFLVGTAHVSRASAEEVREVMRAVRPDSVVLELCQARADRLMAPPEQRDSSLQELLRLVAAPAPLSAKALQLGMKGFYAAWKHAGLEPGGEFRAALEEAKRLPGCRVVLGDQLATETLQKLAATLSLTGLLRMAFAPPVVPAALASILSGKGTAEDAVERLKDRATVRLLVEFTRKMQPAATGVLLDERDKILFDALRAQSGRVVGVVGLAHVDGIERLWNAANA